MNAQHLIKFSSACSVVAVLVAPLAAIFLMEDTLSPDNHILLITLWCVLPFIWGIWAMLIPKNWLPFRFPQWGAVLGLILGIIVVFFLDLPGRIFELSLSFPLEILAILIIVGMYYLLWILVKKLYLKVDTSLVH